MHPRQFRQFSWDIDAFDSRGFNIHLLHGNQVWVQRLNDLRDPRQVSFAIGVAATKNVVGHDPQFPRSVIAYGQRGPRRSLILGGLHGGTRQEDKKQWK